MCHLVIHAARLTGLHNKNTTQIDNTSNSSMARQVGDIHSMPTDSITAYPYQKGFVVLAANARLASHRTATVQNNHPSKSLANYDYSRFNVDNNIDEHKINSQQTTQRCLLLYTKQTVKNSQ